MTLQRRLLLPLLFGVPVTWLVAFGISVSNAGHEINELFDTQQVRLAQQVASLLPPPGVAPGPILPARGEERGVADLGDLSIAVWTADGSRLLFDRESAELPFNPVPRGFADATINGDRWRTFYLRTADGTRVVAVGQDLKERRELLADLLRTQLWPWAVTLPLLLLFIALSVRRTLRPVQDLARDLDVRHADDLRAVRGGDLPDDLQPVVVATNRLFERIGAALENERRLTADAAHELRTPLAALRAQWEAAQLAPTDATRARAMSQVGVGIDRLSHLVGQLLALAGAESMQSSAMKQDVSWQAVARAALSDCLPLMEARGSDVEVHWPADAGAAPLPLLGDETLLGTLLRNLIDNALRYAPAGSHVNVRFAPDRVVVEDSGPGVPPDDLLRLGQRFHRGERREQAGSGLGLSIVRRIALLHGLDVVFANRDDAASGLRVEVRRRGVR